jgi:hypothetical protein
MIFVEVNTINSIVSNALKGFHLNKWRLDICTKKGLMLHKQIALIIRLHLQLSALQR